MNKNHYSSKPLLITAYRCVNSGLTGGADRQRSVRSSFKGVVMIGTDKKADLSPRCKAAAEERATAAKLECDLTSWTWQEAHSFMAKDLAMIDDAAFYVGGLQGPAGPASWKRQPSASATGSSPAPTTFSRGWRNL